MELEYKNLPFEIKQTESDDNFFFFQGHAAVFNTIDRGGDRILPGAFKESLENIPVKILWQHKTSEPLGVPVEIREDAKGLFVRGKMPKNDDLVKGRVVPQMEVGSVDSLSIGFLTKERVWREVDGVDIRDIVKVDLFEFSPVSIPMNPDALITSLKTVTPFKNLPLADRNQTWSRKTAVASIREHTGSTEKPTAAYRRYFMWYDRENASSFGAYKLPYATWLDGQFKAVPRALIAIKAAIGGARGGVDIPEADKPKILRHVERYLSQLQESEKMFILEDVKGIKTREDCNAFLKETGLMSKGAREHFAAFLPGRSNSDDGEIELFTGFTKELKEFTQSLRG
jgi:HK97 family phage prohead protease